MGQLLCPPRPNAVAALGGEQRRRKTMTTDQSPDGRVVAGDVRPQLRDHRLNEELLVEPRTNPRCKDRRVVAQQSHVLLQLLDGIRRRSILDPVADLVPEDAPKDGSQGCADKQLPLLRPGGSAACAASRPHASEQVRPILNGSARPPRCQRGSVERHAQQLGVRCP